MKFWFCLLLALIGSGFLTECKTIPATGTATGHSNGTATVPATGHANGTSTELVTGHANGTATVPICKPFLYACNCSMIHKKQRYDIIEVQTVLRRKPDGNSSCYAKYDPIDVCLQIRCDLIEVGFEVNDGAKPSFYPVKYSVLSQEKVNEESSNGGRHIRSESEEICHVVPLKHAHVWCKRYENVTTCDVECQEGYFLQEGDDSVPRWTTRCKHDEDTWAPYEWQECFPAVSCKARLVKTGKLKCVEPVDSNPYCEISCYEDETHDEVPLQRYDCYDDRFEDILPHCAVLDMDVKTVRKPKYWEW